MPAWLLQKPNCSSKAKEHASHLTRRLELWNLGKFDVLLSECRAIQHKLKRNQPRPSEDLARTFAKFMMEGKVKKATNLLTENTSGGPMKINDDIKAQLLEKHPSRRPPEVDTILPCDQNAADKFHPIIFEEIDAQCIQKTVLQMDGAAGPSGLDTAAWKRLCSSFGESSNDLCKAIASVARRLCTEHVDPTSTSALLAGRLIALDKCPGIRPIGVGETLRRIIARAVTFILKTDIRKAAGPLQLCAGQDSGCESAIHALYEILDHPTSEAVLLIDATNAFNNLNRETAMRNITSLCPSLATIIINTYRGNSPMFIDGQILLSQEGTTQGDPLAMAMYAIATVPLIQQLRNPNVHQIWYADDASATSKLPDLKSWWDQLSQSGPKFGYFPNPKKSWLVVKEDLLDQARTIFDKSGIQITSEGQRYLGGCIGSATFAETYACSKIANWEAELSRLCDFAISQPQAAYTAFTHGLVHKWTFLSRTLADIGHLFQPLKDIIRHRFIPALTGRQGINDDERTLFALPVRLGGLNIPNPTLQAKHHHQASQKITSACASALKEQATVISNEQDESIRKAKHEHKAAKLNRDNQTLGDFLKTANHKIKRSISLSKEKGASNWLTVLPIMEHGFCLHKGAFRDALCLRYGWTPNHLPANCVCGRYFSVEHALSCNNGGFPIKRHNELRDITANLLDEICTGVGIEPTLQPLTQEQLRYKSANREDGARLDVVAEEFWGTRQCAFFDVRIFNPFAPSLVNTPIATLYCQKEQEKRRSYDERIREVEHATFAPLVFSTSGGMGPAAAVVYKRIASLTASKQKKSYALTLNYIRCRISFSLLHSAILCLRGHRSTSHQPRAHLPDMEVAASEGRLLMQPN